jgi:hypothetical protein
MASCLTIQRYHHFQKLVTPYLSIVKLSAFTTSVRTCMRSRGTLVYKHVSAEEQMTVSLSIQRH